MTKVYEATKPESQDNNTSKSEITGNSRSLETADETTKPKSPVNKTTESEISGNTAQQPKGANKIKNTCEATTLESPGYETTAHQKHHHPQATQKMKSTGEASEWPGNNTTKSEITENTVLQTRVSYKL